MKFIPRPVIIGFTTGIAIIIFSGQIANFFGMKVEKHEAFMDNMKELVIKADTINLYSVIVAIICFVVILLAPRILPRVPGPLLGLLISTMAAYLLFPDKVADDWFHVWSDSERFSGIPSAGAFIGSHYLTPSRCIYNCLVRRCRVIVICYRGR
ncbi:SulP family inorganic anion transporter [Peribacillus frigoritolerans]|nr:SulP family inorganic anion transporter [Peribacillus frigoritolerans]